MPVTYDQITPRETVYLCWKPAIPRADVSVFFGPGAVGKGRMLCSFIAGVTNGQQFGMDSGSAEPGDVVVIFPEDKADEQVAWRLRGAGADLSRVVDMTRLEDGGRFKLSATPRYPGHLSLLRAKVEELQDAGRNPQLVIIDPIAAVKGIGMGSIQTNDGVRYVMEGLQDMADMTGVSVVVTAHTTKEGKLQGSAGFEQSVRYLYRVSVDPANDALRVVKVEKANNLPRDYPELRFTITEDANGIARVDWMDRERLEEKRTSWRDKLAARKAEKAVREAQQAASGSYDAVCKVGPNEHTLGSALPLGEAQELCQRVAGTHLAWKGLTAASGPASYTLRAG
jgi:hypothetical protein